jgi:CDP-diacylglycerol--glycerol-3-phosphate 3-phosphatidyltransferase
VGLLRTEFLFLGRVDLPSEDEQVDAYTDVARALGGLPLVIRTLDAGADKPLPALATGAAAGEENPALGVRGLRLGLAHPDVLSTQLRAIVRVAADHPVLVMFPMVSTVDEVRRAKALLNDAVLAVSSAGQPVPRDLPVGVMVEVPAAALAAGTLAPEVDFFSIGTNDLTQYTLAADRTNAGVASLADGLHPAVLRLVADVAQGAARSGRWVGVCGELASDPVAVPILVGLGVTELSVRPQAVAATRAAVAATDTASARALAEAALAATSAADVRRLSATGSSHVAHAMPAVPSRLLTGLTVARMVLAPIVVALVLAGRGARHAYAAGAVVFALAALTDLADGFLARRWGQTSTLGSVLDTAADKILVTAVLVALVSVGRASPWWASVIVGRELAVLALRAAVASAETTRERTVAPSWLGKLKANVEFAAITLAIVRPGTTWGPWHPDEWLLAAAGVLAVVSAVDYGARFLPAISGRGRRR